MSESKSALDFSLVLASTVHDIKNSLSMLLNGLDEMSTQWQPQEEACGAQLSRLRYEGRRINDQLIQLLVLYRIGEQHYSPNMQEYAVSECLEECVLEHQDWLALKGIALSVDCDESLHWCFDRELVMGVVATVINNAYKHARDSVCVSARRDGDGLAISVVDNGAGYPTPMLHGDDLQAPGIDLKSGGTGLGLHFAAAAAALHRSRHGVGRITTDNLGLDGGGRFTLYLP